MRTWTIDVDGVVVSTGLQVERAFRGFNPHHRKVPSYYPIMAHLAETTHVLRVKNRSGNVHDGKAGLPFLRDLWTQLETLLPRGGTVRFRMDGAFFRQDVLQWLRGRPGYAIKVPFYHWLDLQPYIPAQPTWRRSPRTSPASSCPRRRRRGAPGLGGDLSQARPPSRHEELPIGSVRPQRRPLRVLRRNTDLHAANLWRFACGRGNHEKTIAQLKTGLAFHTVPTMAYAANSAWQQLVVLVHNLLTNFQIETGAVRRAPTRKRTVLPCSTRSRRCASCSSIAPRQFVRPGGVMRLRLTDNAATRQRLTRIEKELARAA